MDFLPGLSLIPDFLSLALVNGYFYRKFNLFL